MRTKNKMPGNSEQKVAGTGISWKKMRQLAVIHIKLYLVAVTGPFSQSSAVRDPFVFILIQNIFLCFVLLFAETQNIYRFRRSKGWRNSIFFIKTIARYKEKDHNCSSKVNWPLWKLGKIYWICLVEYLQNWHSDYIIIK